jgi:hypothetical protein
MIEPWSNNQVTVREGNKLYSTGTVLEQEQNRNRTGTEHFGRNDYVYIDIGTRNIERSSYLLIVHKLCKYAWNIKEQGTKFSIQEYEHMDLNRHNLDLKCHKLDLNWHNLGIKWRELDLKCHKLDLNWHKLDLNWHNLELKWRKLDLNCHKLDLNWHNLDLKCHRLDLNCHKLDLNW